MSATGEDGMVLIQAKLLPDEASLVMKAVEAAQREAEEREQRAVREAAAAEAEKQRQQIVVAITPSVLVAKSLQITMDDGTRISAETVRRLACDAGLVPAAVDEKGKPLDVGRKTRSIPIAVAVAVALRLRDGGCCQFPGCTPGRGSRAITSNRGWTAARRSSRICSCCAAPATAASTRAPTA